MKPITKIIIFLVIAFIIIIGITFAMRDVVAPTTIDEIPTPSVTATPSPTENTTPTPTASSPATYTLAQVAQHKTAVDCWTAVGGNVYNLTPFVSKHPGGVENITKVCGIDGTVAFTAQHGSTPNAQKALASLKIGILAK